MIIGVDESGDFKKDSRALFVGIFIRPSDRAAVVEDHRVWERAARRDLGLTNELKGYAVTDEWARVFVNDVLAPDSRGLPPKSWRVAD